MTPVYWGIFIPNVGGKLDQVVIFQHVTFGYKTEYPDEIHGQFVDIKFIGYANDGKNEAYEVELPEWTKNYYKKDCKPHITLSVAWCEKPVNSSKLDFKPIEPFETYGVFGYFDGYNYVMD